MRAQMSTENEGQCILREVTGKVCKQFVKVVIVGYSGRKAEEDIWKLVSSAFCEPEAICILGTLGVGKTAIAVAIHNRALKEPVLFDSVIWVSLKYGGDLWQVQEDIARSLKIDTLDIPRTGDVIKRAQKLHDALLRTRKFLLVLDSMWQPFSLKDIGIPELVNGRKLIITSRIRSVCKRNRRVFELKPLPENEAWELFKYEIGSILSRLHEETLKKTESAVADLDGLPLAISNLAQTLCAIQEVDPAELNREWMIQLAELATKPIYWQRKDRDLFNRFKCSSDNLKVATRSCLMYCALFPKHRDIESKELMEHWMWEGLLGDNMKTIEEGIEKARETLEELKNAHLLQSVTGESVRNDERVKLLSLFRSMSIDSMVDEDRCCFFSRSGCSLTALPWKHEWPPKAEIASFLQHNQLTALKLRGKSKCWRLSTLLLQNNSLTESILDQNFFTGMLDLRVLNLSRTLISILPKSLSSLRNLHALLVRNCSKLKNLPDLSQLEQLTVLDLSGTALEVFPKGIQNMKMLRRLDFSDTRLGTFPLDIVRHLTNLEELLLITDYDCVWGTNPEGQQQIKVACVEDLVKMPKLSALQLHFQNTDAFDKYVSMAVLYTNVPSKFRFRVGEVQIDDHVEENSLTISGSSTNNTSELVFDVVSLQRLRNLHVLDVSNFNGISYLFEIKILTSLTMLRVLRVRSCNEMVNVLQPGAEDTVSHPVLTKMVFFDLPKLTSICCGKLLNCPNLISIDVWRCQNLKLPLIESETSKPHLKIRVTGEKNWIKKLKSDNPGLNTNFKLDDVLVPLDITAVPTSARKKREEGDNNANVLHTNNTYKNTMLGFGALKYVAGLLAPTPGAVTPSNDENVAEESWLQWYSNYITI